MSQLPLRTGVLRWTMLGVVAVLGIAGCSPSDTASRFRSSPNASTTMPAESAAAFQKVLDTTRATGGFPGVIARVISPAGIWTGTSGVRAAGGDDPISPEDHTRIGSLTKTMTATLLLQLVQEERVSLDDPISKYVPDAPNGTATVRQVADMTSGIPSYTQSEAFDKKFFADPESVWTPLQLVGTASTLPPSFPPGRGWEYSNTNYVLLGLLIEEVLDSAVGEMFENRIFAKLGMDETSWPGGSVEIPDPHLDGLTDQGQADGRTVNSTRWNPSFAFTAGAVISTIDDLQTWGEALFTGRGILDPATQQLRRDSILTSPPPNTATAGYGIGIGNRDGWWGHDGDFPGYNTSLFHNYESDTTIIIVVNSDDDVTVDGTQMPPVSALQAGLVATLP
ncbi:beta-lactamase family protein [Gordonia sp. zg691]|uniref:serine hydrolase domain-containing protein n=1 Tax=Gordonia jinghuaiqii TaxID=2758710 RepID=UPI0016628812|nr:serine hydrolase domain-containing protein [Gordonia jinghuaiqii]MBD0862712.1 beta-lactamase family protein [Gordonia jinghuaiqii]